LLYPVHIACEKDILGASHYTLWTFFFNITTPLNLFWFLKSSYRLWTARLLPLSIMKTITAATLLFYITPALSSVVFLLSSETNGQGLSKSCVVDRWKCQNLGADIDKQASWAFVASGLANGCFLYE